MARHFPTPILNALANRVPILGCGWAEFISLPFHLSAEAPDREERHRLLDSATMNGCIENYPCSRVYNSGAWLRIGGLPCLAASGRRWERSWPGSHVLRMD
ncbi:MEKHLA domain-containing protein [Rhizobium leguminosarum bv. viciae]|nr:MEKHLA domain-containing protein [Rhizobium leguminosarum bv. viciae]TCA82354.1 MEKHLA domain-containing protein [Rhizobium leguminosarum bv. viciae]TCA92817.1 MEKHLA domain-containing protein [Rhizobium leguminosarum bv. viciae]